MGFWTALVVIVALVIFAKTRNDRLAEERQAQERQAGSLEYTAQLEREIADLRKRVEVLERIITDERGSGQLARQIDALRDE